MNGFHPVKNVLKLHPEVAFSLLEKVVDVKPVVQGIHTPPLPSHLP